MNNLQLWYTEEWTENVRFSIKVNKHLYTEVSPFQQVDVMESPEFGRFLTLDGLMMVNEKDEFVYHEMITHVPMAVNPTIQRVLVIGGGDGGTVRDLCHYESIKKIDMVEIDKAVVDASIEFLPYVSNKLNDERVTLYFEDGVKFVEDAKENSYDLVIVDSTDPIGPGEGLFTTEFYQNCYRILSKDGILVNQNESPYFAHNRREMKRANEKIKNIFPITKVYQAHMSTYPSGHWLFGFASKSFDPIQDVKHEEWEKNGIKTKYYNSDLHIGAFMLPQYVKEQLELKESVEVK